MALIYFKITFSGQFKIPSVTKKWPKGNSSAEGGVKAPAGRRQRRREAPNELPLKLQLLCC